MEGLFDARILEGNIWWRGLLVFTAVLILTLLLKAALAFVIQRLRRLTVRTSSDWDDILLDALSCTKTWAIFIVLAVLALPLLDLHESVLLAGRRIMVVVVGLQVVIWGTRAIRHWRSDYLERKIETDASSVAAIGLLATGLQVLLLVTVVLFALSNLGIDVGALVAGLGIGGIAVALAAQNVLGDLLASLSIVLDKPFVVGDFIVVGDKAGTVENVGVKTTRLTALSGEQLVFSNKNLLESQIQNFKRMRQRRIVLKIGVTYSTPEEKLRSIPQWIRGFVEADSGLRFDRCHFSGFGGSSIDFELVYFVLSGEYNDYMDRQQNLLFAIFTKFTQEKIDFAFPSQSVYVEKLPLPNEEKNVAPVHNGGAEAFS